MNPQINIAIQVVPTTEKTHPYTIIDEVIDLIKTKGYTYIVCPFETVVECSIDEGLALIKEIHEHCYKRDVRGMLVNIKIQSHSQKPVRIEDKIAKYKKE